MCGVRAACAASSRVRARSTSYSTWHQAHLTPHILMANPFVYGEVVPAASLERFVAELPNRRAEITEPYIDPLWHRPWVFLLAIGCLLGEWGLRRWKGMP